MIARTRDAYQLLHDGTLALADVEANGFKVNLKYLDRAIARTSKKIDRIESKIIADPIYREFQKAFGNDANIDSPKQVAHVLFDRLGYKSSTGGTKSADKAALEGLMHIPFVRRNQRCRELKKMRSTYLVGIRNETGPDGLVHASFNLNFAVSYRSQCNSPNLQNVPVRDEEQMELIRSAFVPYSEKYTLAEVDMSGAEVRVGAFYHLDPTMLKQIRTNFDPHKTLASKIFKCELGEVSGPTRQEVKSDFTFAQQYGSFYIQCAQRIWDRIGADKLATASGVPLYDHLKTQGITRLGKMDASVEPRPGTFEKRIRDVESMYWNEWYPVYNQWRKDWYRKYCERGEINTLTGFTCRWGKGGLMSRNDCINYPVQGSAFHCLLKTLIYMNSWLKRHKMKSKIVCQIHDSIIFCIYKPEFDRIMEVVRWYMLEKLPELWPWIICPLEVEGKRSDDSWAKQEKFTLN